MAQITPQAKPHSISFHTQYEELIPDPSAFTASRGSYSQKLKYFQESSN